MRQSATHTDQPAARRRISTLLTLTLILLGLTLARPASAFASSSAGWSRQSSGTTDSLNAVAFANASDGWAVGEDGTILATTDGAWPSATLTSKLTLKLSGLTSGAIKFGKSVTATGAVKPTSLAGGKVTLTVQREQGGKWLKVTSMARTIRTSGAYSGTYKPARKSTYRMKTTIAETATHTAATTTWLTFKVRSKPARRYEGLKSYHARPGDSSGLYLPAVEEAAASAV
jgi:hypothetical protein